ncbi:MAG: proline--tRNA ligase [Patescibacteria group bacterium]
MAKKAKKGSELSITKRTDDYSQWYLDVVAAADLAENSPVRGCMVIKPYGYALWENIQIEINRRFKEHDIQNAYFPIFIPESFIKKEAEHIEGFAPELAVVTQAGGKKLEEPLVVRPTSETIINKSFSKWIESYRDLPYIINQWANVVRWEMRPRLFLRSSEFLWQEGHTAHATPEEARDYALMILQKIYQPFVEEFLAMPVLAGIKSRSERFAGAKDTYGIEALMQDGKSLQAGTSHDLSDHFAKSFDIKYLDKDGKLQYVYQTSWGVSTRLIGGLIMMHGDDNGLILPPKIAPHQVVIIPIAQAASDPVAKQSVNLKRKLERKYRVHLDKRYNLRPGEKYYEWEKKGVPVRVEIGPRDLESKAAILVRRDTGEKMTVKLVDLEKKISQALVEIQKNLYQQALNRREDSTHRVDTWPEFAKALEKGGYVLAHWCESEECEADIKAKVKAVSRCLTFDAKKETGEHKCIACGKKSPSNKRWVFAKAY